MAGMVGTPEIREAPAVCHRQQADRGPMSASVTLGQLPHPNDAVPKEQ